MGELNHQVNIWEEENETIFKKIFRFEGWDLSGTNTNKSKKNPQNAPK